jgi:8-oxo-dGTP pyrophosphatase MutT (NUDIX family)
VGTVPARRSGEVLDGFAPPVPADVAARAEAMAVGRRPVEPRRSASVVLLRDGARPGMDPARGVEVYLMHRHERMPFAPSVAVFPGGGVDAVDASPSAAAADPVLACALRETAEETTVRLDADALVPWARWVTPAAEPRRYDTTFYLAALPGGQEARDVSGETVRAAWTSVRQALADREAGDLVLMPPTWSILVELAAAPDVATLLRAGAGRQVETVLPRVVRHEDGWRFAYEVLA